MAVVSSVLARLRSEPLADIAIADRVNQLCIGCGHRWRDRLLTPLVTLRLFLIQVLHGNTAIAHLRQLCGLNFAPSSYCQARKRLPLNVILGLLSALVRWAQERASTLPLLGSRVLVLDGSSFSTADTPELRQHFGLWPGGKPGVTYPMGKLLGLLDAATGLFVQMLALPLLTHDLSGVAYLHPSLQPGDVLLGDRAFGAFAHFALLQARGLFGCFRLHQARKTPQRCGRQQWHKPKRPTPWMSLEQFAALPQTLMVRLVSYRVAHRGFRTRQLTVATTLLDERLWPDQRIADLYGQRWQIETCFDHLKTTLKMNMLKCQNLDGVMKELAMYLLVYNLVRVAMLRAAQAQRVSVSRISFVDAMRQLAVRMLGLPGTTQLIVNPDRTGRWEPRVIRGRMKAYDLLVRPRAELKAAMNSEDKH